MRKLFVLVFAIALCLSALCIGASAADIVPEQPAQGDGTATNPYQIGTAEELYWFAQYVNNSNQTANAKLTENITINTGVLDSNGDLIETPAYEWTPIESYSGTFDGNGMTISGLYLSETVEDDDTSYENGKWYTGMFRTIINGTVKDLKLSDSYVGGEYLKKGGDNNYISGLGGICGASSGTVSGCTFRGTLYATSKYLNNNPAIGGICGLNTGSLDNCEFYGKLEAKNEGARWCSYPLSYGGGICGCNYYTVRGCTNWGTIKGSGYNPAAGGICGVSYAGSTIEGCVNHGNVTATTQTTSQGVSGNTSFAAGILAIGENSKVERCENCGEVKGANYAGGIAGKFYGGNIISCTNSGTVEAYYEYAGGICAYAIGDTSDEKNFTLIKECANSAEVKINDNSAGGTTYLGGICGRVRSFWIVVVNCYNTGTLYGYQKNADEMYIGGICGRMDGESLNKPHGAFTWNCCNTGSITAPEIGTVKTGGVCGAYGGLDDITLVAHCIWLGEDSTGSGDAVAMTQEQFERGEAAGFLNRWEAYSGVTYETFTGKVWKVGDDGYPVLDGGVNDVVEVKFVEYPTGENLMTFYTNKGETLKDISSINFVNATLSIDGWKIESSSLPDMTFNSDTTITVGGEFKYKLTATVTGSVSKEYDGDNTVNPSGLTLQLSGIISGYEDVKVEAASFTYDNANAGEAKVVTANSLKLTGDDADKYVLSADSVSAEVGTITKKELTASIDNTVTKVYNGTTDVTDGVSIALNGVVDVDNGKVTATATYAYDSKDVGSGKTITASGITLGGTAADNYSLSSTSVTGEVGEITRRTVTPTITGTLSKVYDGTTAVQNDVRITLDGVVNNDSVTATAVSIAYDSANAGATGITATGIALSGPDVGNYSLGSATATCTGAITPKTVTITADDKTAWQGYAMPALTYTTDGLLNGDGLAAEPVLRCDAEMTVPGTYPITVSGGSAGGNYALAYVSGTLSVRNSCIVTLDGEVNYVRPGGTFTLPTPRRSGYAFLGWACSDGKTYSGGDELTVTSDLAFTASWVRHPDTEYVPEPEEPEFPFYDVPSSAWYYSSVKYVYENGLMDGVDTHIFAPNDTLTRAMVWTIIARMSGVDTTGGATWYAKAQDWVVMNGISDGENPTAAITRQELVTMLYRYAQIKGYDVSVGENTNILSYVDATSISEYAMSAFQWACGIGLTEGDENGALTPLATATRAQAAAMIMRFCQGVK